MTVKKWIFVFIFCFASAAFGQHQKPATAEDNSFTVKTYAAPGMGSVYSHYIVTNEGVIVIDSQRVLSQAANLLREIKATGKPVIAVILTHNHPDHIGGLAQIVKEYPDVPIYATQTTIEGIAADKGDYQKGSKQKMKDDFPDKVPVPNRTIRSGEALIIGGVTFEPRDFGTGEAESILALYVPAQNILFSSDLIANRMTPFMLEKHTAEWVKQLDAAQQFYPHVKIVYPGHGGSGNPKQLIEEQRKYLVVFRQAVAKAVKDKTLSPEEKRRIVAQTERRYAGFLPVAEIPDLLEKNVDAVAQEIQAQPPREKN